MQKCCCLRLRITALPLVELAAVPEYAYREGTTTAEYKETRWLWHKVLDPLGAYVRILKKEVCSDPVVHCNGGQAAAAGLVISWRWLTTYTALLVLNYNGLPVAVGGKGTRPPRAITITAYAFLEPAPRKMSVRPGNPPSTPVRGAPQAAYSTPPPTIVRPHPLTPAHAPVAVGLRKPEQITLREYWAELARNIRNDIPADTDDFALFTIANADSREWAHKTYEEVLAELIDPEWTEFVQSNCGGGDDDESEQEARHLWATFMDKLIEPTGEKPLPGDQRVEYIAIGGTGYSLHFWPGSLTWAEYCMDFVKANDLSGRAAVNVPEGYAVWVIPDADVDSGGALWMFSACTELASIERTYGIEPKDIKPGEEKFVLRDGMHCQLVRDEHLLFRFQVPRRPGVYDGVQESPNNPLLRPIRG
ncbi:hypothetical protein NUW54_g3636 [Trametes sanguinea]|uniref:Uncharacterized protein n=1 Tax=Trametes sanguinea TaxID=158606 RepID=A0ACC1Q1B8_9APHY|nr:hypothetical protein NUW54_g3636 [Trametes sanguinea]